MPDAPNPYLDAAIHAADPENVGSTLALKVTQAIQQKDPSLCFHPELLRAAASAHVADVDDIKNRFTAVFGLDFRRRDFDHKLDKVKQERFNEAPSDGLVRAAGKDGPGTGPIKPILANAVIQLATSVKLAYDTFASRVVLLEPSPWGAVGAWTDADDRAATEWLQHRGVSCGTLVAHEAALRLAEKSPFNSLTDHLDRLKWDGEPRLDTWLTDYLGAEDSNYIRAIAAAWPISAVARARRPGCKADHMLLLEGPQGKRKSMALRAFVNGHLNSDTGVQRFGDDPPDVDDKDIKQYIQGLWIIELAELDAIRGKEWSRVKRFISTQKDRFRAPYGHNTQDYARQCIFAGSTNEDHWAGDPTGSRRHWPVKVGKIRVECLLKAVGSQGSVRDQIWAEAVDRYDSGAARWWLNEEMEGAAQVEQAARMPDDPWIEWVGMALDGESDTSLAWLMDKLSGKRDLSKHVLIRALATLGWEPYRQAGVANRPRRYRRLDA